MSHDIIPYPSGSIQTNAYINEHPNETSWLSFATITHHYLTILPKSNFLFTTQHERTILRTFLRYRAFHRRGLLRSSRIG